MGVSVKHRLDLQISRRCLLRAVRTNLVTEGIRQTVVAAEPSRPGPGRRRTGVTQIHVKGKGDMPEPLRVFANLSGSAHAGRWMHRPQQGQVMKIFEPVALRLQHLAESDRERQRHITLVGPTTSLAQGISARRQQARACLAAASFAAVCPSMTSRWVRAKSIAVPR